MNKLLITNASLMFNALPKTNLIEMPIFSRKKYEDLFKKMTPYKEVLTVEIL